METLITSRWVIRPGPRRSVCAVAAIALSALSIWPQPYVASALLAPDDSAAGLTGLFSGGSGINLVSSLLGGRGTIEADLLVGRSNSVFTAVAKRLQDQGYYRNENIERVTSRLQKKVEVESARGSILQVSIKDHNPELARRTVEDFVIELRHRLTELSREQADAKLAIAKGRMEDATREYDAAKDAVNNYRAAHNFTDPQTNQSVSQGGYVSMQAQLVSAITTLKYLERTLGPENIQLQTARERVGVLQQQIAMLEKQSNIGNIQNLEKLNPEIAKYQDLLRAQGFAQGRFDIYQRYLESLSVQQASATLNMAVIDPPFIEPQRHFNLIPLGLLVLVVGFATFAEFYLSTTIGLAASRRAGPMRAEPLLAEGEF